MRTLGHGHGHGHALGWRTAGGGSSRAPGRVTGGDNMAAAGGGLQVPGGIARAAGEAGWGGARAGRGVARDGTGAVLWQRRRPAWPSSTTWWSVPSAMRSPSTRSSPRSGRVPSGERPAGSGSSCARPRPSPALSGPTPPSGLLPGPGPLSPAARPPQAGVPLPWVSFPLWPQGTSLALEACFSHPEAPLCPRRWLRRIYSADNRGGDL